MAEQDTGVGGPGPRAATDPEEPGSSPRLVVSNGPDWLLVQLEDAHSWDLLERDPRGRARDRGRRLAHITITDRGYMSVDAAGIERGPYTTLDEAAYPVATHDRVLLDDPDTRVGPPPLPSTRPGGAGRVVLAPRASLKPMALLVGALGVGAVVAGVLVGASGRRR